MEEEQINAGNAAIDIKEPLQEPVLPNCTSCGGTGKATPQSMGVQETLKVEYTIKCCNCGKAATVPFKPSIGSENRLKCKECFKPGGR